ncbi:hypothetical protein D3C86_1406960 [compost metagenome]
MGNEREDREGGERRQRPAKDQSPANLHFREPVHAGSLNDFIRIAAEGLVEQEDSEDRKEERHHHREIGIQKFRLGQTNEKRQCKRLNGNAERRNNEAQQQLAAREPELCQRIGSRNRCQHLHDENADADNDAVQHETRHRHLTRRPGVVIDSVEFLRDRPERDIEDFRRRADRGQHHPVERQEHHESAQRKHEMREIFAQCGHQ